MNPLIACPQCRAWLLDSAVFNQQTLTPCPSCATPIQIEVFPALFRKTTPGESAQPVMLEGESSCFFHPQKKAVVPCAGCGRFLCALCDCEFNGGHFCPACLEAGKSKGKIQGLENQRTRYDSIALALAIFPLLIYWFTLITAPMTIFVAIRYWNAPRSMVRRSRFRFILAIVIALLEIGGWIAVFVTIFTIRSRIHHT